MSERAVYLLACKNLNVEPEPPPTIPEPARWFRWLHRLVGVR